MLLEFTPMLSPFPPTLKISGGQKTYASLWDARSRPLYLDVGLSSQEAHPLNNHVFPLACFELSQGSTLREPAQARSDLFVY
jgi:hypothetical protein